MRNAGLEETQGIKIAGRNDRLYLRNSTLMTGSEEEIKGLLMKVKAESEKAGLKLNIQKTMALTRWSLVGKVISLFFNMLSRLVITFLPRSKHLLISWLHLQ